MNAEKSALIELKFMHATLYRTNHYKAAKEGTNQACHRVIVG